MALFSYQMFGLSANKCYSRVWFSVAIFYKQGSLCSSGRHLRFGILVDDVFYILTSVLVLRIPNADQNIIFCFHTKKLKKEEKSKKFAAKFSKKMVIQFIINKP